MKTKYWIGLLALLLAVSIGLSVLLLGNSAPAQTVEVISRGKLLYTLPLNIDRTVTVETPQGFNTVTVKDGKVAVTEADCPDGHCMARGFCAGGPQIVCLPHRLVLKFTGKTQLDGITG